MSKLIAPLLAIVILFPVIGCNCSESGSGSLYKGHRVDVVWTNDGPRVEGWTTEPRIAMPSGLCWYTAVAVGEDERGVRAVIRVPTTRIKGERWEPYVRNVPTLWEIQSVAISREVPELPGSHLPESAGQKHVWAISVWLTPTSENESPTKTQPGWVVCQVGVPVHWPP